MRNPKGGKIERLLCSVLALCLIALPLSGGSTTAGAAMRSFGRSLYFTVNPQARVSGPILSRDREVEYFTSVFQLLVQESHQLASDSLAAGDERLYWAFLVAALTLPHHESKLVHFRDLPLLGGECIGELNSGESLKTEAKGSDSRIFDRHFKHGATPFLPECEELNRSAPARQMSISGDLRSIGMMQLNMAAHEDDYLASQGYASVPETIRLGIRIFHDGFMELYRRSSEPAFKCLREEAGGDPMSFTRLIRGAWAGKYNSGKLAASCRFAEKSSKWALNDAEFNSSLEQVLGGSSLYGTYLQGVELAAYREIIDNFNNRTSKRESLDKVLGIAANLKAANQAASRLSITPPASPAPRRGGRPIPRAQQAVPATVVQKGDSLGSVVHESEGNPGQDPNMMVTITPGLNIRTKPAMAGTSCGILPRGSRVQMVSREAGNGGESWMRIRLPDSSSGDYPACMLADFLYVYSAWLRPASEIPAANQVLPGQVVGAYSVNIRELPPRGKVIEVAHEDDVIQIVGRRRVGLDSRQHWYKLSSGGWIYGAYVELGEGNP